MGWRLVTAVHFRKWSAILLESIAELMQALGFNDKYEKDKLHGIFKQ